MITKSQRAAAYRYSHQEGPLGENDRRELASLIAQQEPLAHDLTVFRSLNLHGPLNLQVTDFMSTALDAAASRRFGASTLQITVPKGSQALFMDYEQGLTRHFKDMEVLLPPGGIFVLNDVTEIDMERAQQARTYALLVQGGFSPEKARLYTEYRDVRVILQCTYYQNRRMTKQVDVENARVLAEWMCQMRPQASEDGYAV